MNHYCLDMWRSSKLWSIEYQDGDLIGKLLCHISMLAVIQPFVAVAMALAGSKRGARLAVGLVVATVVCRCLKMVINSPRPDAGHLVHPGNSGFPSDHSLSCKYWQNSELVLAVTSAAFAATFIHFELRHLQWPYLILKLATTLILSIYPFLVMFSRVYLQYHTFAQVAVGMLIGIMLGRVWSPLSQSLETYLIRVLWPYLDNCLRRVDAIVFQVKHK